MNKNHKKIGIIGGLSPESTVTYYLYLTRKFSETYGNSYSPEIIIYSVNLEEYHKWRDIERWDLIVDDLAKAAEKLKAAGADYALIATNTMHKVFDEVSQKTSLPLISLLEAVLKDNQEKNIKKVGLIGTKFSMSDGFYSNYLEKNNISVLTPNEEDQKYIHEIIEEELVKGKFLENTKKRFLEIIDKLREEGAEGIILGCTEIPLLIKQEDCDFPVFDTATIHAEYAYKIVDKDFL